jgi:hypothetical protein
MSFPLESTATVYPVRSGTVSGIWNSTAFKPWTSPGGTGFGEISGKLHESLSVERRIRFSGAYMYHVPVSELAIGKMIRSAEEAQRYLGLELTPEVLWNLSPWTWLADWNVNLGEIISNITNFQTDSLVLKYGYIMCETRSRRSYTLVPLPAYAGYVGPTGPFTVSFITVKKERVRASPYGFALDPSAYSGRQWAILSALGLSKSPDSLH